MRAERLKTVGLNCEQFYVVMVLEAFGCMYLDNLSWLAKTVFMVLFAFEKESTNITVHSGLWNKVCF